MERRSAAELEGVGRCRWPLPAREEGMLVITFLFTNTMMDFEFIHQHVATFTSAVVLKKILSVLGFSVKNGTEAHFLPI